MLARGALRRRELAVRAALGANRIQLVRLLLAEHLVLFATGAAAGLLLAWWLVEIFRVVVAHLPVPVSLDVSLSPLGAAFTFAAAAVAGLACGLGPALGGTRFDLLAGAARGRAARRLALLVAAQPLPHGPAHGLARAARDRGAAHAFAAAVGEHRHRL